MRDVITPLLRCSFCAAPFENNTRCKEGHLFLYVDESLDLRGNLSEEVIREIQGTRASECISGRSFVSEKEILENNLILEDMQSYIRKGESGSIILEIGCGFGYLATELAKAYPQHHVIASDVFSFAMKKYRCPTGNLSFLLFPMEHIPLVEHSVDYVIVKSALHHTSHLNTVFNEIYRVLKPGGIFFVFNEVNVALCERAQHFEAHENGCNDQPYSFADYKKAARQSAFSFYIKRPRMFTTYIEKGFLSFPQRGAIKKMKMKILLCAQRSRMIKFFAHALYPLLLYFFLVPSFFICIKKY